MKIVLLLSIMIIIEIEALLGQNVGKVQLEYSKGYEVIGLQTTENKVFPLSSPLPLISLDIDGSHFNSTGRMNEGNTGLTLDGRLTMTVSSQGLSGDILNVRFRNISEKDTIQISNIVPFGENPAHIFITGRGEERLSRTKLFQPGKSPVSVIVPDNAWELGYSIVDLLSPNTSAYGLARRNRIKNGTRRRFWTLLNPGGELEYTLHFELFQGPWQQGLRKCFQDRYLYDLEVFDDTFYQREDLAWIREAYVIHLMMAWDHHFYDSEENRYLLADFIKRGKQWYGGDDVIGIWPTWPTLGLDERNQWDLYHDLPGGTLALKDLSENLKEMGTKLFISYNPWDESTRMEDHLTGMAELIKDIDADGVVLDTRGSSSAEIQEAADQVKEGVVMFSEGMAVPKDMPGIISGRVHNALYYPPILNLNKLIKPDFAIFRVAELTYERIRREYVLSFFNGYGTEINMFKPGQPSWIEKDYRLLGQISMILRENHPNFISKDWTPLISVDEDSIYVNEWPVIGKTIFTIFSQKAEGFKGTLFEANPDEGSHFVDLWNHEEINAVEKEGKYFIPVKLDPFNRKYLGTNNEGSAGCIAQLPDVLELKFFNGKLQIQSIRKGTIKVWKGDPEYSKIPDILSGTDIRYDPGRFEGKLVIQLFDGKYLTDEKVHHISPGAPKLISQVNRTKSYPRAPKGMVRVSAGTFRPEFVDGDTFIYYPKYEGPEKIDMKDIYVDIYPVTNKDFYEFLNKSNYSPEDTVNFLKHWESGKVPKGMENYPVVYLSLNDAKAYAKWAGKRLPTELEWQYAAQTGKHLKWPWGNEFDSLKSNSGNGRIDPVGKYENGVNPNGLSDLVGNVWQMTNDTYESGSYTYTILKGGSYFKPTSSWWYVKGGPRELRHRQILLHVSEGFDRNATVGFRCVADLAE